VLGWWPTEFRLKKQSCQMASSDIQPRDPPRESTMTGAASKVATKGVIFGASGLLGKALMREWTGDDTLTGFSSKDVDIRDSNQVAAAVERARPDWIVLAAAYTDVDGCETNRDLAFAVNCQGAVNVAGAAKQCGSRLLFVSTDYVFDGTKTAPYQTTDARTPRSVYGRSKAEAEVQVLELIPDCCIVRTSWLFGPGAKCFPDTILQLAATRGELDVVDDQRGCPTYAPDLAQALIHCCRAGARGIVHATNRGACTWFEFAREIVERAGAKAIVRPTTSDKFVRPAERPKYSVLAAESLEKYGICLPTWQDALQRYLAERA
jgi:dTDP-4-dehydrorhamnose reductase